MSVPRREYLSNDVKVVLSSHRGLLQRHARLCSSASALSSQDCMSMSRNIVEAVAYGKGRPHFFRWTFRLTFSSRSGTETLPSVEAMRMVFPYADRTNSFERSTVMVSLCPSTVICTFYM